MPAKRLAARTYLFSTVSELYDAYVTKCPKSLFLPHFCFPWDAPGAVTLNVV